MKCDECGGNLQSWKSTVDRPYVYRLSGLERVSLVGLAVRHCPGCDVDLPEIPKIGELHSCIVDQLIHKNGVLNGAELRFLRKYSGFTAIEFSEMLAIDAAHLSRIENGHRAALGKPTDRLARAIIAEAVPSVSVRELLLQLEPAGDAGPVAPAFVFRKNGWRTLDPGAPTGSSKAQSAS